MNANDFYDVLTFTLVQFYRLEFFGFLILVLKIHWLSGCLSEERLAGASELMLKPACTYIPVEVCCCTGNLPS